MAPEGAVERLRHTLRRTRRLLDRSEWAARLVGLAPADEPSMRPGLLIVQIDGLAHSVLGDALAAGAMPFVAHLLADEGYSLHHVYSGLPSSTPVAQAELFYGVRTAVPAFSYLDRRLGRIVHMWQRQAVTEVEERFAESRSLLAGGASYANVYAGRADQARFCMASLEWTDPFRTRHPVALPGIAVLYGWDLLRAGALVARELVVGAGDLLRGALRGQHFVSEVKFAWSRALVAVMLRELCAIGVAVDLARGLPAVHVNFLGYDEHAHRRGPGSALALRALGDIDRVIARLAGAAWRSPRRTYDVWLLSDHGQEETRPYAEEHGRAVQDAIRDALAGLVTGGGHAAEPERGIQGQRVRLLGDRLLGHVIPALDPGRRPPTGAVAVTAQGPLGHVYLPRRLGADERDVAAQALVGAASIPLVLAAGDTPGTATAWTASGRHLLPADAGDVVGVDHPYLADVARDLVELCGHPDAGDLIISGWTPAGNPVSFPHENGSHAGPGPTETDAFALVPADTELAPEPGSPLRAGDLRRAGLDLLDRPTRLPSRRRSSRPATPAATQRAEVRVMTYNVHSCVGLDGRLAPERIARVIARHDPDVVALQELDVGRARTGHVDQAAHLAEVLEMLLHFHPTLSVESELYGDAVLSRLPLRVVKADRLPRLPHRPPLEPRGALWVEIDVGGTAFHLVNTHLSLHPRERRLEVDALLGPAWLGSVPASMPVVLCGDFNSLASLPVCRRIRRRLHDAQLSVAGHRPRATWAGRLPLGRIDHVFVDPSIEVVNVEVAGHALARAASDHLPLVADLRLP